MARTNNLTNFLTDVSAAIKQKTGDSTPIPAANFDTEILSIETAGTYQTKSLNITTNGSYQLLPDQDYDAMDRVNISVAVPSENLDSVITAQENKLDALEEILENKVSGSAKPNIYVQDTEPTKKDGIWLKMSNTTAEHFVSDDNIFVGGTWSTTSDKANIPYSCDQTAITSIGTDIYIFGGNNNTNKAYKYNTLTNTWTQLANIPYTCVGARACSVGSDIYIFGSSNSSYKKKVYKYNTLTDIYTKMNDLTTAGTGYDFTFDGQYGDIAVVGTDIYLFSGAGNIQWQVNKYDIDTDTTSFVFFAPHPMINSRVVVFGTDIYLIGGDSYATQFHKYNTLTNTWTQLANIPFNFAYGSAEVIGSCIYIFGNAVSNNASDLKKNMAKYDILTNTWTKLDDAPFKALSDYSTKVGVDMYYFSGTSNRAYHAESKSYETDNTVVIAQGRTYSVGYNIKLFNTNFEESFQPLYGFADAFFYTLQDGLDGTMPVYYGNGTQWINIKNPPMEGGNE